MIKTNVTASHPRDISITISPSQMPNYAQNTESQTQSRHAKERRQCCKIMPKHLSVGYAYIRIEIVLK